MGASGDNGPARDEEHQLLKPYPYEGGVAAPHELLIDVIYHFQSYVEATRLDNQAHHLVELCNKMSDLKSWLPDYDSNTGTIAYERDDEEY